MQKLTTAILIFGLLLFWTAGAVFSQEKEALQSIQQAEKLVKAKQYSEAVQQLQMAIHNLSILTTNDLKTFLPDPLPGWKADAPDASSPQAAGMGIVASGIASRHYYQGDKSVDIEIAVNSPLVASLKALVGNPLLLTMSGAGQIIKIQGYKAVLKTESQNNHVELNILPGTSIAVSIKGDGFSDANILKKYASRIDLKKLVKRFE